MTKWLHESSWFLERKLPQNREYFFRNLNLQTLDFAVFCLFTARRMHSTVYAVVWCLSVQTSVCHSGILCRNNRIHHQAISTLSRLAWHTRPTDCLHYVTAGQPFGRCARLFLAHTRGIRAQIQTQSLALRALRKRKQQETQALAGSSQRDNCRTQSDRLLPYQQSYRIHLRNF